MLISSKVLGSKKRLFDDWAVPIPPEAQDGGGGLTLAQLIERIVREEVKAFRERQHARQFVRALTADQIESAVERGKVEMGASEVGVQHVDPDQAVGAALQAFEDGLYLVIIDEQEQRDLEKQIYLQPDSRITFIRLAMLTGG